MDLKKLSIGYELDLGGYAFQEPPPALEGVVCILSHPDLEYFGLQAVERAEDCEVFAFAPSGGTPNGYIFPTSYFDVHDGVTYVLIRTGNLAENLRETQRDCPCRGQLVELGKEPTTDCDSPIPVAKLLQWEEEGKVKSLPCKRSDLVLGVYRLCWNYTGNFQDPPYPLCPRCEGEGYVSSPGGEWAFYRRLPTEIVDSDPDVATYVGNDRDGCYFQVAEFEGLWFVTVWVDCETSHFNQDLITDYGPFSEEAQAIAFGKNCAEAWCTDNAIEVPA